MPPHLKPEVAAYGLAALDDVKLLPGKTHFICEGHLLKTSVVQKDYHHKVPQEAGGSDSHENIAAMCTGCHQLVHRLAMMLSSFKGSKHSPFDVAMEYAVTINKEQANRVVAALLMFAQLVAQYRVMKADNKIATPDGGIVSADMPHKFKVAYKQIARDIKRGDGRSIGMSNLATLSILNTVATHFPDLKEEIDLFVHSQLLASTGKAPTKQSYEDDDYGETFL